MTDIKITRFEYVGPEGEQFEGYRVAMPSGQLTFGSQVFRDRRSPDSNVMVLIDPIKLDAGFIAHNVNANRLFSQTLTLAMSMMLELESGTATALERQVIDTVSERFGQFPDIVGQLNSPSLTSLLMEAIELGADVELVADRIDVKVYDVSVPTRFLTSNFVQQLAMKQGLS